MSKLVKIEYEQSYEICGTTSTLELMQKASEIGLFNILESEVPTHTTMQKQKYESLLKLCDSIAKKIGGKILAVSRNDIKEIYLTIPFLEFCVDENDEYDLIKSLIEETRFVSISATENNQITFFIMI